MFYVMRKFYSRKGIEYKDKLRADQEPSQKIKNRESIYKPFYQRLNLLIKHFIKVFHIILHLNA